ncbi:MAG: TAXI family TRAP transporter solute-binding subunit [Synergistaceae bacterium]|nr:TAXI family TRAP transporter solute-binding subunit [Synergistaceae bacterium]
MRKIFSLALILALALSVPALAASSGGMPLSGPYPEGSRLTFATGGEQGEYYAFGAALAEKVSRKTATQVHIVASRGAMSNIEALDRNNAKLAFIQSDVGFYASRGTRLFSTRHTDFSTVAVLYPEPVQIVTLNPEITHIEHLRGRTVSVGAEGSGTYFNAVDVFSAYGMDIDTDINPVYESFGNAVDALKAGKIDAAFIVAGTPTPAVSELAKAGKVYLVSFDDRHIMDLIAKCPYYTKIELPKSTYGTDDNDVTVAVNSVVVARDDVKMEDVYNFMYGVFENLGDLAKENARAKTLTLKSAASYPAVPYHPGAVKYLGEKGILVSGKK